MNDTVKKVTPRRARASRANITKVIAFMKKLRASDPDKKEFLRFSKPEKDGSLTLIQEW